MTVDLTRPCKQQTLDHARFDAAPRPCQRTHWGLCPAPKRGTLQIVSLSDVEVRGKDIMHHNHSNLPASFRLDAEKLEEAWQ